MGGLAAAESATAATSAGMAATIRPPKRLWRATGTWANPKIEERRRPAVSRVCGVCAVLHINLFEKRSETRANN